jgi:hypothetical protein
MNGLLLASEPQSKDIKFDPKKVLDIGDDTTDETGQFFENLMDEILSDIPDTDKKSFFLSKILNLPENIGKNEEIRSLFTNEPLFTDHQIEHVCVETLVEIASFLKNTPQQSYNISTESDSLKTALLDTEVQKSFKNAKIISDLLKIAEKNGIKVKNFEFFKEDLALDTHSKQMVQKVNSEEIFKLMENRADKKIEPKIVHDSQTTSKRETAPEKPKNLLKDILTTARQEIKPSHHIDNAFPGEIKSKPNTSLQTDNDNNEKKPHTYQAKIEKKIRTKIVNSSSKEIQTQSDQTKILQTDKNTLHATTANNSKSQHPKENIAQKVSQTNDFTSLTKEQNRLDEQLEKEQKIVLQHSNNKQQKSIKNQIEKESFAKAYQLDEVIKQTKKQTDNTEQNLSKKLKEPEKEISAKSPLLSQPDEPLQQVKNQPAKMEQTTALKAEQLQQITKASTQTKSKQHIDISASNVAEKPHEHEKIKPLQKSDPQTQTALNQDASHDDSIAVSHETKPHQTSSIKSDHNDIKKTFNTFAQEFKEKVESYKPPLMKIKMQLSPEKLGDVDVTLINRGNNLHVNINSSPSTIALFAQNQAEFKNSLINMGFTGLQMNFGENRDNQRGQQHKNENKQSRPDTEEANEIDGFEMTVPQYI